MKVIILNIGQTHLKRYRFKSATHLDTTAGLVQTKRNLKFDRIICTKVFKRYCSKTQKELTKQNLIQGKKGI